MTSARISAQHADAANDLLLMLIFFQLCLRTLTKYAVTIRRLAANEATPAPLPPAAFHVALMDTIFIELCKGREDGEEEA